MRNKTNVYWKTFFLIVSLGLGACQTLDEDKTYSKDGLTVNFLHTSRIEHEIEDYQLEHPISLSARLASNHLLSLLYKMENSSGKIQPVFSAGEARELGPLFQKALGKLSSDTYLHFKYQSSRGTTEGEVFGTVDKIHWRFQRINGSLYSSDILNRETSWTMARMAGQVFHKVDTAFLKMTRKNWIVANFKMAHPRRRPEMGASDGSSFSSREKGDATPASAKEKLKKLKGLLDEGLIDKQEYETRREEILNRHF